MVSRTLFKTLSFTVPALFVLGGPRCWGQTQKPVEVPFRASWKAHRGLIWQFSLSLDGRQLLTCGHDDGTVKFWDLASGSELRRFTQESRDGKARIWDEISPGQRRLIKEVPVDDYVPWFNDSPSWNKRRSDLKANKHVPMKYPLHFRASLLPDNRRVVLRIGDYFSVCPTQIIVYNLEHGGYKMVFSSSRKDLPSKGWPMDHVVSHKRDFVVFLVANPGNTFAGQGRIKTNPIGWLTRELNIYNITEDRNVIHVNSKDGLGFQRLALSDDDRFLANTARTDVFTRDRHARNGRITIWDLHTGVKISQIRTDRRYVDRAFFAPNGNELVILGGHQKSEIYIASLHMNRIIRTLSDFSHRTGRGSIGLGELHYTPNGRFLVGSGAVWTVDGVAGAVIFWDAHDYQEVLCGRLSHNSRVCKMAFTPDGSQLLAAFQGGDEDGLVKVWDMKDFTARMPPRDLNAPKGVRGQSQPDKAIPSTPLAPKLH